MKNTITTYSAVSMSAISAAAQVKRDADKAYKDAKTEMVKGLAEFLNQNPDAVVLNKDLARQSGLTPGHMASIVSSEGYNMGIQSDTMTVTKQYAEIDENGNLVPGGTVRTERKDLCVFRKRTSRRW